MLPTRLRKDIEAAKSFRMAGASWSSILLYPIRRRMRSPRHLLQMRSGISLSAPPGEDMAELLREVWTERCYAPAAKDAVARDGLTVVDIGAHVGLFTLWIKALWPDARVVSLEPSPRAYPFLCKNVRNNLLKDVTTLPVGCAGESGSRWLYERGSEVGNSFFDRDNYGSCFSRMAQVEAWSLKELFDRMSIARCDLLKLDCEGSEYEILLNATAEDLSKIDSIALEYHIGLNDGDPNKLKDFLTGRGFQVEMPLANGIGGGYLYARRKEPMRP